MFDLSGRRALVTGSARGLGLQMVRGLAAAGAQVIANGRDADTLDTAVDALRADGLDVLAAAFDVTDEASARSALAGLGDLDILVNNVGHRDRRGFDEITADDLARLVHVHAVSAYVLSRDFAQRLRERGAPGRIINVSSVMARLGRRGDAAYPAAKAAIEGMTRALAVDLGRDAITVNAVAPGTFLTEVNAALADDAGWLDWLGTRTALGRWGRPPEIAGVVVFLAADESSFVTGQTIAVDGGMTITF